MRFTLTVEDLAVVIAALRGASRQYDTDARAAAAYPVTARGYKQRADDAQRIARYLESVSEEAFDA